MKLTEAKLRQLILEAIQEEEIQQLEKLLLNLAAFHHAGAPAATFFPLPAIFKEGGFPVFGFQRAADAIL